MSGVRCPSAPVVRPEVRPRITTRARGVENWREGTRRERGCAPGATEGSSVQTASSFRWRANESAAADADFAADARRSMSRHRRVAHGSEFGCRDDLSILGTLFEQTSVLDQRPAPVEGFADMASIDESKEKLKELYATREEMEKEMAEIAQRLTEPGMPGLRGALVDREGFPIPGVDLYQVRGDRGRYATLRNDHSEVTKELEKRLAELHLQAGVTKGVAAMELTREAIEKQQRDEDDAFMRARARAAARYGAPPSARAFAYVDEVTPRSPADEAGMRVGDVVTMFGDVVGPHEAGTLPAVAAALAEREGEPVAVWVSRGGTDVRLDVTPRRWEGRGLLGCHMRPR